MVHSHLLGGLHVYFDSHTAHHHRLNILCTDTTFTRKQQLRQDTHPGKTAFPPGHVLYVGMQQGKLIITLRQGDSTQTFGLTIHARNGLEST